MTDGENHLSVPMSPSKDDGEHLQRLLEQHLPWLLQGSRPDILLFQAGADPLRDDPYSPLDLDHRDLFLRDEKVFAFARSNGLPTAWVLAGGYAPDVQKVVDAHVNTAIACLEDLQLLVDALLTLFQNRKSGLLGVRHAEGFCKLRAVRG